MVNFNLNADITRAFTPVEKVADHEVPGKFVIREVESRKVISHVSKQYTLVQNSEIFKPFIDHFGLGMVKQFQSLGKGKFCMVKINTGRTFDLGTIERPDVVDEQILVRTSYDKTRSFNFMMGAFRRVCLNGMYSGQMLLSYRKIHVGYIPVNEIIHNALTQYNHNSFDDWFKLRDIPVTPGRARELMNGYNVFANEKDNQNISELNSSIRQRALNRFDTVSGADVQKNGWGLYNQFNRYIELYVKAKSKIDSVVSANKRLEKFLLDNLN